MEQYINAYMNIERHFPLKHLRKSFKNHFMIKVLKHQLNHQNQIGKWKIFILELQIHALN